MAEAFAEDLENVVPDVSPATAAGKTSGTTVPGPPSYSPENPQPPMNLYKSPPAAYSDIEDREMNLRFEKELYETLHVISLLDLLEAKTKLEKDGEMTEGLAACFRHAMEMVRKDKSFFDDCRLLIQADGHFLTFQRKNYYKTYILWYDQYLKIVEEEHLEHY